MTESRACGTRPRTILIAVADMAAVRALAYHAGRGVCSPRTLAPGPCLPIDVPADWVPR